MVFEHLFPERLLEQKHWTGFVLAAIYSTISIMIARLLFPANSGIVSIVFVSIFLIPYMKRLLWEGERKELSEKRLSLRTMLVDNKQTILVYGAIFLGIYFTYMFYSFLAPYLGYDVSSVFREQLSLESLRGGVVFDSGTFFSIFLNNWWVLLACFLIALVAGDGAIFFIAWNASTWGTIFGYRAVAAGLGSGESSLIALLTIIIVTIPHLVLEGGAYILAAIAGGVISDEVDRREEIRTFVFYFVFVAITYVVLYLLADAIFGRIATGVVGVVIAMGLLSVMHRVFSSRRDRLVFRYNYYLFAIAIGVFILGAIIETFVLYNSASLNRVYLAAMAWAG